MREYIFVLFLGLIGLILCSADKNEADNVADSSVTSYSTVVIHHPHNKKSKDGQESRSQSYFKVKRLRASTLPPAPAVLHNGHNGGDFRPQTSNYRSKENELKAEGTEVKQRDFKPSQYLPEAEVRVSFRPEKDQAARATEFGRDKEQRESEFRKNKYSNEQAAREPENWRQHFRQSTRQEPAEESREVSGNKNDRGQYHREVFRHDYRPQQEEKVNYQETNVDNFPPSGYHFDNNGAIPAFPAEIGNPFEQFASLEEQRLRPIPPPGMSEELIETLLSQQPQTFDSEKKPEQKKKSQTFKVGYSIGFGGGEDVVMGRPKDVRLHVNGKHSVWKSLPHGVEMSHDVDKKRPMSLKIQDSSVKSGDTPLKNDNVLKNDVYYMHNYKPDTSVPTYGRTSFNHEQALTNSNPFDFSNAVDPKWFKQPRALDMGSIYQSLGYPPPLPVVIPGGPRGEGTMVHAIVIPIESIGAFDINWPAMHQVPMIPLTQSQQPVEQALTLSPVVTTAPLQGGHPLHSRHHHQPVTTYSNVRSQEKQQRFKSSRLPKAKDSLKQGSYNSAPIVVAPAPTKRQAELQRELNNILAEEMMRKNQRLPVSGLRPPPF